MINTRHLNSIHIQEFFSHLPNKLHFILKRKNLIFKKNVLEIGCGQANTIIDLKNNYNINAYAIDINAPEDKLKLNNIQYIKHNLKFIDKLKYMDMKFDFIYSFRVFLHLDMNTRTEIIKFIFEKLNSNGIAIIDYTGDYSRRIFDSSNDDNILINEISKIQPENIDIRIVQNVMYRADPSLIEDIHKSLYRTNQIAFVGNILIITKKK